jgi:choline dehydrogenase-like flavoprotein
MTEVYDYIIVGGGPAGCAVASCRAQRRADARTALLEAGPEHAGRASDVPLGIALHVPRKSARNYAYATVPQPGLNGRPGFQPRGRGLGGSSLVNAMVYRRGQPQDRGGWAHEGLVPARRLADLQTGGAQRARRGLVGRSTLPTCAHPTRW